MDQRTVKQGSTLHGLQKKAASFYTLDMSRDWTCVAIGHAPRLDARRTRTRASTPMDRRPSPINLRYGRESAPGGIVGAYDADIRVRFGRAPHGKLDWERQNHG